MDVRESIRIEAPVERVYSVVVDPANWPRFVPELEEIEDISSERMEPGTTFRWKFRGGGPEGEGHVNQHVPNSKFSMTLDGPFELTETYTFIPAEHGTELSVLVAHPPEDVSPGGGGDSILRRIKEICEQ